MSHLHNVVPYGKSQFQSLFSWNLLLMALISFHQRVHSSVSILVFVELALDVLTTTKIHWDNIVSILVFVELALDGKGAEREEQEQ